MRALAYILVAVLLFYVAMMFFGNAFYVTRAGWGHHSLAFGLGGPMSLDQAGVYRAWSGVMEVVILGCLALTVLMLWLIWKQKRRSERQGGESSMDEGRLMQQLYQWSVKMEKRMEDLETILLGRGPGGGGRS